MTPSYIRSLRVSGHKDYVALDLTNKEGQILATPFYLRTDEVRYVHFKKKGVAKPLVVSVRISPDFTNLLLNGGDYIHPFDALLNTELIQFIP